MKKEQKVEVRDLIQEFKKVLYLEHWDIDVEWHKEEHPQIPKCAAECTPNNEYKSATIRVFPMFYEELPEARRMIILHEMTHIITAPLYNLIGCAQEGQFVPRSVSSYHWEETTTWVAQIIFALKKKP